MALTGPETLESKELQALQAAEQVNACTSVEVS